MAVVLALGLLVLGLWTLRAARTWHGVIEDFLPAAHTVAPPTSASLAKGAAVSFGPRGDLRGWYTPGTNRSAVLFCHGTQGDRLSLEPEAALLASEGFGTLLFDFPGQGESAGRIEWAGAERAAIRAAVDFLVGRPDVDPARVGAFGFSFGAAVLLGAGADDPRIHAVVSAASFDDAVGLTWRQAGGFRLLLGPVALVALRSTGFDATDHRPLDAVASIAPRPLLLVHGTNDGVVPIQMAWSLHAAAREPKRIVVIDGAGHGNYMAADGATYTTALRTFFSEHLIGKRGTTQYDDATR